MNSGLKAEFLFLWLRRFLANGGSVLRFFNGRESNYLAWAFSLSIALINCVGAENAAAAVTITGVTGASVPLINPNAQTTGSTTAGSSGYTIYGGNAGMVIGGNIVASSNNTGLPFNTCKNAGVNSIAQLIACNANAIDGQVVLNISYHSDKGGFPILIDSTSSTVLTPVSLPPSGTSGTVSFLWSQICSKMATSGSSSVDGNTCWVTGTGSVSHTFSLGINLTTPTPSSTNSDDTAASVNIVVSSYVGQDSSASGDGTSYADPCTTLGNSGVCGFNISNGDSKVQVDTLQPGGNFPMGTALPFTYIRALWTSATGPSDTTSFANITANSSSQDLRLNTTTTSGTTSTSSTSSGSLSDGRVQGLQNDLFYAFKIALVDEAGNVGYYTSVNNSADTYCTNSPNPSSLGCHIGHPGEVVGVLSQNMQCFIATAAYGSQMAPQVDVFRQFRNEFLLSAKWGVEFVKFYYRHSPKYARIIAENEFLRATARVSLWPLLAFAWLSLHLGFAWASLISFIAITLLIWSARRILQTIQQRRRASCTKAN
jgi:hypothetical protein